MQHICAHTRQPFLRAVGSAAAVLALAACSVLPPKSPPLTQYDFGPQLQTAAPAQAHTSPPPLILATVNAVGIPEASTAIQYRLAYANANALLPYTQARWTVPAPQLIQQRIRDKLGQTRAVLLEGDGVTQAPQNANWPAMLRLEVEEFSQVFDSPSTSSGVMRLRATLTEMTPKGEKWLDQHIFTVQQPALSADAAGGSAALAAACAEAAQQLDIWLHQKER